MERKTIKTRAIGPEGFIWLFAIVGFFTWFASRMGVANMFGTMMSTGHDLLLNTCFFLSAVCTLAGAVGGLFSEFGVIAVANKALYPLMRPLYGLPGAASVGVVTTFLSDNPAILSFAADDNFKRYFNKNQFSSLVNLGTAYGMGLIVVTFMIAQGAINGTNYIAPVLIGLLGAALGSIISVRLMQFMTRKDADAQDNMAPGSGGDFDVTSCREIRDGSRVQRFMEAILDGGKKGFDMSMVIAPGIITICTIVMMLTKGPGAGGVYNGSAYQGVDAIRLVGKYLNAVLNPLFGFRDPTVIVFPLTSLGAVGAAIGTVPQMLKDGIAGPNEIAVFTAIGICWSGFLSTHIAMMEAIGDRKNTMKAIGSHAIGGLLAGILAHFIFIAVM